MQHNFNIKQIAVTGYIAVTGDTLPLVYALTEDGEIYTIYGDALQHNLWKKLPTLNATNLKNSNN